ncbi:NucA/NucB deoxyribonuclease domain-containing protein [Streptomyces sp. VNUA24]|uniref:NucA/NucB deoxyribonuclease domain-containing protein n=1 Tax=Streptomyces sp. VNUA24 TaxID=3031131 RepID=UPI0023B85AD2|nr:NucA/NucB deoxyribonuclease domain-containing protein [Streptomyces sp. VNUA24]WEH18461.1 NucA/NucB deoxyribonuclease domain-containing protein [Streptomyces sp. VNUA24]
MNGDYEVTFRRTFSVTAAIGVLAAAVLPVASPAAAASHSREMHTSVLPVGTRLPSLSDLQRAGGRDLLVKERAAFTGSEHAPEVVGPAATYGRVSNQRSAVADPPVTYPEPARTMTPQECIKGLGTDKKFFFKSRFASCSGAVFFTVWSQNGRPVGETQFVYLSVGTIAKDSRDVRITQYFTKMQKTGAVPTSAMMIKPSVKIPQVWPKTAKVTQTGTVPGARSFDVIAAQQPAGFTRVLKAAPGQGSKPADAVASVFEASAVITPPPGYTAAGELSGTLFFLPPRWDKASYLPKSAQGGAVFTYLVPLVYSTKAGSPEKAVADHIKTAFTKPGSTKPTKAGKKVPGSSAQSPLHRLYHDNARRKKNRSTAVSACKKAFGKDYAKGGKECDEYPFATTYEGCAQNTYEPSAPKNNFSVRPLAKKDNGNAGNLLGQFMTLNRILDGDDDGFYVTIK